MNTCSNKGSQKIKQLIVIIFITLLVQITPISAKINCNNDVYIIDLVLENSKLRVENKLISKGCPPKGKWIGDYSVDIVKNNKVVYSSNFNPTTLYSDIGIDENIQGNAIKLSKAKFSLVLPKEENAQILIKKDEKEILTLDSNSIVKKDNKFTIGTGIFGYVETKLLDALSILKKLSLQT